MEVRQDGEETWNMILLYAKQQQQQQQQQPPSHPHPPLNHCSVILAQLDWPPLTLLIALSLIQTNLN